MSNQGQGHWHDSAQDSRELMENTCRYGSEEADVEADSGVPVVSWDVAVTRNRQAMQSSNERGVVAVGIRIVRR
jgi:hypothetical protein